MSFTKTEYKNVTAKPNTWPYTILNIPKWSLVFKIIIRGHFYSQNNVKELFRTMNTEVSHLNYWLGVHGIPLNIDKIKYVLFYKTKGEDNLSLVPPDLFINDVKIKRENSLTSLEVMTDDNLTCPVKLEQSFKECGNSF